MPGTQTIHSLTRAENNSDRIYTNSDIGSIITIYKFVPTTQSLKMVAANLGGTYQNVPKSSQFFLSYQDINGKNQLQMVFSDTKGIIEFEVPKAIKEGTKPTLYSLTSLENPKISYSQITDVLVPKEASNIVMPKGISYTTEKSKYKEFSRIHFKKPITSNQLKSIEYTVNNEVKLDTITY